MTHRMMLVALLSVFMLIVAACEVDDDSEDVAATDDTDTEEVTDDPGSTDEVVIEETDDAVAEEEDEESGTEEETTDQATENEDEAATEEQEEVAEEDATTEEQEEASDETDTEPAVDPDVGTRENPMPFSETASIGEWEIQVIDTTPDATQIVMDENQFNDPPAEGNQFFIARVAATYHGDDSGTFWIDVRLRALDDGGVAYEGMEARCGVIPDNISDAGEVFPGATIEGNTCWSVSSEHVGSLLMIVEPTFSWDRDRLFFALNP
jgi:hypothetical protein